MTAARVPLRRLTSLTYGDALASDVRIEGDILVMSSGGVTGRHNRANTKSPCIVVGRKGSHGSVYWSEREAFVIDTAYSIDGTNTHCDLRWLYYVLLSANLGSLSNDVGVPGLSRELAYDSLVPSPPPLEEQRRIAAFLDDQTTRIDQIITARQQQIGMLEESRFGGALAMVRGDSLPGPRKSSGLTWVGAIPADWPMVTVNTAFEVLLGKMLDESKFTGRHAIPYLRNTNVQWDRINIEDLKEMDIEHNERSRFTVRAGDLLICEGGQPGRSAVWDGRLALLGYQKALHRARARDSADVRWLQNYLRAATYMNVFAIENGQTTIGHLTGEQLRSLRLPLPKPQVQRDLIANYMREVISIAKAVDLVTSAIDLLQEFKRSLISAAVSGEFDVSSASGRGVPS